MADTKLHSVSMTADANPPVDTRASLAPDPSIRSRLLAQLSGRERYTLFADDVSRTFGLNIEDALNALRAIHDPTAWADGPFPGSRVLTTPQLTERRVVIAELPLGTHIPKHGHSERELTLVLDGELLEGSESVHGPGSVLDMPVGSAHEIAVVGKHACLAVFCQVSD
jgi:hypothetical protein